MTQTFQAGGAAATNLVVVRRSAIANSDGGQNEFLSTGDIEYVAESVNGFYGVNPVDRQAPDAIGRLKPISTAAYRERPRAETASA